jgi:hypothetical protein
MEQRVLENLKVAQLVKKLPDFYEGVSKSFRIVSLERKLQTVQLSATRFTCIDIL